MLRITDNPDRLLRTVDNKHSNIHTTEKGYESVILQDILFFLKKEKNE